MRYRKGAIVGSRSTFRNANRMDFELQQDDASICLASETVELQSKVHFQNCEEVEGDS